MLKIFFGMAAGVGKTYAMLATALERRADGADVVVGVVETHGRPEAEALLQQFEIIPRRNIADGETAFDRTLRQEMDLDAIIARAPRLVLVDELAHRNAVGSRHSRRYQDVIELLERGIDVYTTVNVQHFESRADAVTQITGRVVHDTVPDSLLDRADEIALIDISPEDLRRRLYDGRVNIAEPPDIAAHDFFRIGNLTALREMALRMTAEHVDHQLQAYMQRKHIDGPWHSSERLMVAVGPSPFSERLIRWTRRAAYTLEAPWLALYVQTSDALSPDAKERLARNLALVRELGGEIVTAGGDKITETLLRVAHQHNVTQIVIGKAQHSPLYTWLRGGSVVEKLVRQSGDIDVYVVTGDAIDADAHPTPMIPIPHHHSSPRDYVLALAIVGVITLINGGLFSVLPWIGVQVIGFTELLGVLLIAVLIGRGPALLAALVSALSWNVLILQTQAIRPISRLQDIALISLYFATALIAGSLTARLRRQEQQARYSAERSMALYTLAHETATAVNMDDILKTAVIQIGRTFDAEIVFLLASEGDLAPQPHPSSTFSITPKDLAVAYWVFGQCQPAGRFTETLNIAEAQYHPLRTPRRTVGVIGICTRQTTRLSFDQAALLETFINQVSLVIEREILDEAAEQAAMLRESERLYSTLFNSISHELRTPIAAVMGAVSSLQDRQTVADPVLRDQLTGDIHSAAERLNGLVENLLDMSRLESGRLVLKQDWCDIGDLIGVVVKRLEARFAQHPLKVEVRPDVPLLQIDFVLLEQALVNVVENACAYTPAGAPIRIDAERADDAILIRITDHGAGIPQDALNRVFDKFYRAPGTATGGTGLGLSISKGLIEAHDGRLSVHNMPEGGAQFTIWLPLKDAPPPVRESDYAH